MASQGDLALVLGGGGARAAYQVGFLRALGHMFPRLDPPILTGVSAGAISAAFLANHQGQFGEAVEDLAKAWETLTVDRVFHAGSLSLANHAARWGVRLVSGGARVGPSTHGMVDTSPLREYVCGMLKTTDGTLPNVAKKIADGRLSSLAITTTRYSGNQSVTWVQSSDYHDWNRPFRRSARTSITVDHVMASSALPIFFPAIRIGGAWHGDGGIRLTAPLAPALHLGADRLIAISTRFARASFDVDADATEEEPYPPPATVIGVLLSSVFLDMLDQDAMNMQRLNDYLRDLPPEKRQGLRPAGLLLLRPSQDISKLASQHEAALPGMFRFLMRGMGSREAKSPDSLSMVLFQPDYMKSLIQIGEADAWKRKAEIEAFVGGEDLPAIAQTGFWRI
ncbi:MAG: patatin-like phospholipase family protein [Planctomycetes bacterium]|nr:patatin-like phospholipase family protein [Planctomycetota bacterium]